VMMDISFSIEHHHQICPIQWLNNRKP